MPRSGSGRNIYFAKFNKEREFTYKSHCRRAPPILHTSQEACTAGLKHYSLELEFRTPNCFDRSTRAKNYTNWECDIICPMTKYANGNEMHHEDLLEAFSLSDCYPTMRRIAFTAEDNCVYSWDQSVSGRHSIKKVILYPCGSALSDIHDQKGFPRRQ